MYNSKKFLIILIIVLFALSFSDQIEQIDPVTGSKTASIKSPVCNETYHVKASGSFAED